MDRFLCRWLTVLFIIIGLFFSCRARLSKRAEKNKSKTSQEQLISVEVSYPQFRKMEEVIEVSGNLEPVEKAEIYAKQSGIVKKVYVDEGDKVEKAQLLAKIEDDEIRLSYLQAKNSYELARDKYKRYLELYKQKMISEQDFKEIERAYKDALSNYELYKLKLENTELRSPISGVVIEKLCEEHQFLGAMEKAFTVAKLNQFKIVVYVTEEDLSKLKTGQLVRIHIDAIDGSTEGYPHQGVVSEIGARVDPATGTAKVEILIPHPPASAKPGMFARLKIVVAQKDNVLCIPKRALVREEPAQVWVVKGDRVELRDVQTGLEDEIYIEVKSGLGPDELVVVGGQEALTEQSRVRVINIPTKPAPPAELNDSTSPAKEK